MRPTQTFRSPGKTHPALRTDNTALSTMEHTLQSFRALPESDCMEVAPLFTEALGLKYPIRSKQDLLDALANEIEDRREGLSDAYFTLLESTPAKRPPQEFDSTFAPYSDDLHKAYALSDLSAFVSSRMKHFQSAMQALQESTALETLERTRLQQALIAEHTALLEMTVAHETLLRQLHESRWQEAHCLTQGYWTVLKTIESLFTSAIAQKDALVTEEHTTILQQMLDGHARQRDALQGEFAQQMRSYAEIKDFITKYHFPAGDMQQGRGEHF